MAGSRRLIRLQNPRMLPYRLVLVCAFLQLLCGALTAKARAGCAGEIGGEWAQGICTIDLAGSRSSACKQCLVGPQWDSLRQSLGTEHVRGKRGEPVTLAMPNWTSGTLLASVFRILAEETLGYDIRTVAYGGGMDPAAKEAAEDTCKAVFTEVWGSEIELKTISSRVEMSQALQASFLGAQGHETLFAPDYMPFISTHYRSLSENIVQVTADGDFRSAMDSFVMDGSLGPNNLTAAGLTAPEFACTADATAEWDESKCLEGRWYPPQCGTEYPSPHCAELYIPSITWSSGIFESAVYRNGLNFSVVYTGSGTSQTELIAKMHTERKGLLYYWWEPDPFLVKYPSVKLILPEESPSCAGVYHPDPLISTSACDNGKTLLRKMIHSSYEDGQPDLHYLWSKFQFSTENINELMSYTDVGGGQYNMEDAACEFLKSSESVDWRSWLQIEDRCIGAGDPDDTSRRFTWDEELQMCIVAMECQPGTFYDVDDDTCKLCGPGTFTSLYGMKECTSCSPGTYCYGDGCSTCFPCPSDTFQEKSGAESCTACPGGTHTFKDIGSQSAEKCVCKEKFYRRDQLPGLECFECPEGGVCEGDSFPPYAEQGYWGDWELVDKTVPDSPEAAYSIAHTAFLRCRDSLHCTSCEDVDDIAFLTGNLTEVQDTSALLECRSDPERVCGLGHKGVMCQACVEGYFSIEGDCFQCPKDGVLFTLGCILALFVVWFIANSVMASQYDAVDLLFIYFQNVSTISTFALGWSETLKEIPFRVLAIVNFDVTYISFDCMMPSSFQGSYGKYGMNLLLQLMLPLAVILTNLAIFLFAKLGLMLNSRQTRVMSFLSRQAMLARSESGRPILDDSWLEEVKGKCIATSSSFINLVIHTVTFKCLETLKCQYLPNGKPFLVAAPDVPCWETQHIAFVVVALLGLCFYSFFIPMVWMRVMRGATTSNRLRDPVFKQRWGWLYLRYERDWYYWELLIVARRCLLVALAVLAAGNPSIQIVGGLAVCVTALTMHCYAHPFIDQSLDDMETVSLVSLMVFLGTGILFNDDSGPTMYPYSWEKVVTGLALASLLGCMAMAALIVTRNIQEAEAIKTVSRKARKTISRILEPGSHSEDGLVKNAYSTMKKVFHSPMESAKDIKESISKFTYEMKSNMSSMTFETSAFVRNSEQHDDQSDPLLKALLNEDLELPETFQTDQLKRWILDRCKHQGDQEEDSDVEMSDASLSGTCVKSLLRFWLVNHWLSPVMSDTSPVSYYSSNTGASFFHGLVSNNMYLVDHLLYSRGEKFNAARDAIKHFVETHYYLGTDGRLARMLTTKDQGAFLAWLLVADPEQIDTVRELMVEIYSVGNDGRHPYEDMPDQKDDKPISPHRSGVESGSNKPDEEGFSRQSSITCVKAKPQTSRWNLLAEKTSSDKDLHQQLSGFSDDFEIAANDNKQSPVSRPGTVMTAAVLKNQDDSERSLMPTLRSVVSNATKPYAILNSIARAETSEIEECLRSFMADMSCPRQALARQQEARRQHSEHQEGSESDTGES